MNSGSIKNMVNLHGSITGLGARGYSNYEIAVLNGFEGTEQEWLDSLVGPVGPRGPMGPNNFHVGEEEPEDENVSVWLDTDEPIPNTVIPVATAKMGVKDLSGTISSGGHSVFTVSSSESFATSSNIPTIFSTLFLPNGFDNTKEVFLETYMIGATIILKVVNKSSSEISLEGGKIRWTCINHC